MLTIDGSAGEGGGQILRSSLALAMCTGQPFRIERIRAGRPRPGLMRQHLAAVRAAAEVCGAAVSGAEIGAASLTFSPGRVRAGTYRFDVGSAGSTTLVLQTVLPALMLADGPSRLTLEGGTHNPFAPPFDFLALCYLPLIARMGPRIEATLERPGFHPAGGGSFRVDVQPVPRLAQLELTERGAITHRRGRAVVANLPRHIAERELKVVRAKLGWPESCLFAEDLAGGPGPGNVVILEVGSAALCEVFTGFGAKGRPAEQVADGVVEECQRYLRSSAPVGEHLADQLLLPMALARGGVYRTVAISRHTRTQRELLRRFIADLPVTIQEIDDREGVLVRVG